jgi:hypothetical protein
LTLTLRTASPQSSGTGARCPAERGIREASEKLLPAPDWFHRRCTWPEVEGVVGSLPRWRFRRFPTGGNTFLKILYQTCFQYFLLFNNEQLFVLHFFQATAFLFNEILSNSIVI